METWLFELLLEASYTSEKLFERGQGLFFAFSLKYSREADPDFPQQKLGTADGDYPGHSLPTAHSPSEQSHTLLLCQVALQPWEGRAAATLEKVPQRVTACLLPTVAETLLFVPHGKQGVCGKPGLCVFAMMRRWSLGEALVKWNETDGDQILSSTIDHFYFQTNVPPKSACSWAGAVVIKEVQPFHTF